MKSYSQIGQDLSVLKHYENKKSGYFVEAGASDGITLSNTYLLEKDFGWRGICVEPIPAVFDTLVKNRPNSKCYKNALFSVSGKELKFDVANWSLISGVTDYISPLWKKRVNSGKTQITVKSATLLEILDSACAPSFIEYLSLDTEGTEFEILKDFNFSKYKFGLIDVEHNYIEPTRTNIKKLLTTNGYTYIGENKFDDCYKLTV
jgi:FkbM family methyltransferase